MARKPAKRDDDITSRVDEDKLLDLFTDVQKGFENQRDRSDEVLDYWDMYNCKLSDRQFYNGTSQIATPFVQDAVEARVTRFSNQVFPNTGRYVEVTTNGEDPPQATQSLLEAYVRKAKLRTEVVPELLRNGDVEGQWSIYCSWTERVRHVTTKTMVQPKTDGMPNPAAEPVEDIKDEEVNDSWPDVEVLSDPDVLILPAACRSSVEALEVGGSNTVIRRWSKGKIKQLIKDKDIRKEQGEALLDAMNVQRMSQDADIAKKQLDAAGIKERGKIALIYETWTKLEVDGDRRLCRVFFGGEDQILGVKLNPFWNDRCPLISAPVRKKTGAAKGKPIVSSVIDLWVLANDTLNEGADTAHFSAMPIVMTDPLDNPHIETMVLGLASVWQVSPKSTEIVTFPALWSDALNRAMAIKDQIFQTLAVNPSMIPQSTGGQAKKRNQAEVAIEQQVDILTTADVVTNFEDSILTPIIQVFAEYDQQFRDDAILIPVYGEMGEKIKMEEVEPIQSGIRFEFRWFGVESARNAAQMQQQISGLNVVKAIPPQMYAGYELDAAPALVRLFESLFGPRIGPMIFKMKKVISTDPMIENEMMLHGFEVHVAPSDDDNAHIQAHMMALEVGDPHMMVKPHIAQHQQQLQAKMVAQAQQMGSGAPGAGGPKPGGQAAPPRQGKGPAGAIAPDSMAQAGSPGMPRKAA